MFFGLVIAYALFWAYEANSSDDSDMFLVTLFSSPIALILGVRCLKQLIKRQYRAHGELKKSFIVLIFVITPIIVYYGFWLIQNPLYFDGVRYKFDYQSESWHEVEFFIIRDGEMAFGPRIGSFPLRVSFPDIDKDGYRDIRITGVDGIVEYRFLPDGSKKKQYWTLIKRTGYKVSYPVEGYGYD